MNPSLLRFTHRACTMVTNRCLFDIPAPTSNTALSRLSSIGPGDKVAEKLGKFVQDVFLPTWFQRTCHPSICTCRCSDEDMHYQREAKPQALLHQSFCRVPAMRMLASVSALNRRSPAAASMSFKVPLRAKP